MKFIALESMEQLDSIAASPTYQVIFKHNTTCPISKGVLKSLEASGQPLPETETVHLLDLLTFRSLSNDIAHRFQVEHQSPQLLVIKNGECVYTEWGYDISLEEAAAHLEQQG